MKYFLILLFTSVGLFAQKTVEVEFTKCDNNQTFGVTYIDYNEDAMFDTLIINECGDTSIVALNSFHTEGKPNVELYKESKLQIRLKNYNHVRKQSYFRVYVVHDNKELGYWEYVMGSQQLIWNNN